MEKGMYSENDTRWTLIVIGVGYTSKGFTRKQWNHLWRPKKHHCIERNQSVWVRLDVYDISELHSQTWSQDEDKRQQQETSASERTAKYMYFFQRQDLKGKDNDIRSYDPTYDALTDCQKQL